MDSAPAWDAYTVIDMAYECWDYSIIYPIMNTNKNDNFYINNDFLYLNFLIADETHTDTRIFNVIKKINFLSNKSYYLT